MLLAAMVVSTVLADLRGTACGFNRIKVEVLALLVASDPAGQM